MHVDAGEAKEKLGIGVMSVYSLREYLIGCKKTLWGDTSQDESCLQRVKWTFSLKRKAKNWPRKALKAP